jgi:glutaminyl-tRNA synthetase
LFTDPDPGAERDGVDFTSLINPNSLEVLKGCKVEHTVAGAEPESRWQFERMGYFCADRRDCRAGALVFNRTVSLKDEWAKIDAKG